MDNNIRQLLAAAEQYGVQDNDSFLHQAYDLLKTAAETKPASDGPPPFGQDLFVLCGELAFQFGLHNITKECLKLFFMRTPPANQFLCRAYLCQAQLLAPASADDPNQLEKAVVYLLKAINFAKENARYHFLVYNASVLYWQFCRPFLKPNFRQYLSISLHSVVKALDDIDDKDYAWRAQLMIALVECHVDAGRIKEASEVSKATAEFTRAHVPELYKQVLRLQIRHSLVDTNKLAKDLRQNGDLTAYMRLVKLRVALETKEISDIYNHGTRLLRQILQEEGDMSRASSSMSGRSKTPVSNAEENSNKSNAPSPTPPSRAGGVLSGEGVATSPTKSPNLFATLTRVASTASEVRSMVSKWRQAPSLPVSKDAKNALLLELARLCAEYNQADLVARCLEAMKNYPIKEKRMFFEMEFLECELMVRNLKEKQENYSKASVETRIRAIKRLMEGITNVVRLGDPNLIQAGCVTMWNLCMPMLQPNLREHVRKPLNIVAEALENIESLLVLLRCRIHTELAKCEEDEEQIQAAMDHLKKAISLDDGGQYNERLHTALHRLNLRAELYKQPESQEDQATMIIEQARKSAAGTVRMKRALLMKAGEALSPEAFLLVLDSESETKGAAGRGAQTVINQLGAKARHFQKCVKKCQGHIKRLGNENERDRARLWADLAKTARKQEVWDVCRVAARFCLLYDDDRWTVVKAPPPPVAVPSRLESRAESSGGGGGVVGASGSGTSDPPSTQSTDSPRRTRMSTENPSATHQGEPVPHSDKDLVRTLAEVHFINSEALIHLLRSQGLDMNDKPIPPEDKSKRPKGYVAKKPEEDPDWINYCDWIQGLSDSATKGFLRAAELGVSLIEPWIVCSASTYMWNYNNHLLASGRHKELTAPFAKLLQALKQVGHACETILLVNLCNALAFGLIQQWIPTDKPTKEVMQSPPPSPTRNSSPSRKAKSVASHHSGKSKTVLVDPKGMDDIKAALEVCDYGLEVTNGTKPLEVVPITVRHPLIITWVQVKQMLNQQINKNLGGSEDENASSQGPMNRCLVALEMQSLNGNGLMDFKEAPPLAELCNLAEACTWSDRLVELQLWTRTASLALGVRNHVLVMRCTQKALEFEDVIKTARKLDSHKDLVWHEMLSYASCIQGCSLVNSMQGKNVIRRAALTSFLNAARFGRRAKNYALVITAARRYWNACLMLVSEPLERHLLKQPLTIILECLAQTASKEDKKDEKCDSISGSKTQKQILPSVKSTSPTESVSASSPIAQILSDPEDDLTLRAAMYGVLFQAYADQGEWEEALAAMDKSITDMPRTKHRLLIFKHRLMVKAKLGRDVHVDIAKFKDESEDYLSLMWHKVAMCSKDQIEQLASYQNAIEALQSSATDWQKVEYLIEFSEWLYLNEFPLQDCVDQLEWAVDILLNMKITTRVKIDPGSAKSSRRKRGKKSARAQELQRGSSSAAASPTPTEAKLTPRGGRESTDDNNNNKDVIPTKKASVIGLSVSNIHLTAADLTSIRQLEHLVRVHIMLAIMAGRGSPQHNSYCLLAWGFLKQIWQVSLSSAGIVSKELAKAAAATSDSTGKGISPKGGNKKGGNKEKGGKEADTPRDKPKRKGPLDAVPINPEEWAVYDVPDEMREAFKADNTGEGINSGSILKPSLTLYYLEMFAKELRGIGYSHLTFPALNLAEIISRDILTSNVAGNTYRLIAADVSLELNLTAAAKFHEAAAGPRGLNEEDQARSREEIAQYKERQAQVQKEAARTRELQRQMTAAKKQMKANQSTRNLIPADQKMNIKECVYGLSKSLSAMTYRQAWTEQAQVLIKQGYYQAARQLLNEAFLASKAFGDKQTEAHILQNLAYLACQEGSYGLAINMLKEAQILEGDETFWLTTTLHLVDATLGEVEDKERNNKARALLMRALSTYNDLVEQRPNKKSMMVYIKAMLEAKFASVQVSHVLEESKDTMKPKAHRELQTACQRFEHSAKDLALIGYAREAAYILQQHSKVLRLFARDSKEKELKHSFLLQAQSVQRDAVDMMEQLQQQVQTATDMFDIRNLSLPVQRDLCVVKTTYAELLIDMFTTYADEQRHQQLQEARKGSVEKLVENFISSTPVMSDIDRDWEEVASSFASSAMVQLESTHNIAGSVIPLKAKCLYNMGKCLRIMANHKAPSPPSHWDIQYMNISNGDGGQDKDMGEDEGGEEKAEEMELDERQLKKYNKWAGDIQDSQSSSETYLAQASEVLAQSVQLGLQVSDRDLVAAGCLELVECCGQFDQPLASHYLALYQSCQSAACLEEVLYRAQKDPSGSCQATLLKQRKLKNDTNTNWHSSDLATAVDSRLQENSQAWRRLLISPEHISLIKELPQHFNMVIFQHSEDKSVLYGSILERPKAGGGKDGGKSKGGAGATSRAKVTKTAVDPDVLDNLYRKFRQYKQDVTQALLKAEYRRSQQTQRQKMLENLSDEMKQDLQESSGEDVDKTEELLQEQFLSLVTAMEDYLKPITTYLESAIRTITSGPQAPPSEECIIILADKWLLEMPLEALAVFSSPGIGSISRDFSLQMLYNRFHREAEEEMSEEKKKKEAMKQKAAKEKGKGIKMVAVERPIPTGCLPVDTHSFRYIVDCHNDLGEEGTNSPMYVVNEALKLYLTQYTARWEGLMGNEHVPSVGEWEQILYECEAFIFYGLERLFSYLPPSKVAPMDLSEMELAILLDLVQTNDSFMRQARVDVHKSPNDLSLEKPIETAMLLSLSGVNCVLANQWHCTLQDNALIFNTLVKSLLEIGRTTGQTLRRFFIPHWKPEGEESEDTGEGTGDERVDLDSSKGGKGKKDADLGKGGKEKDKPKSGKKRRESQGSSGKRADQGGKDKEAGANQSGAEDVLVELKRQSFNFVCYGLPNLIVLQM